MWLILMQLLSSAPGGYLAGRLRTKWSTVHSDEVYFRDTAHGFLVWAVGTVFTAAFLATATAAMAGLAVGAGGSGASPAATGNGPNAYFVDALFRSDQPGAYDAASWGEADRIFTAALAAKEIPPADRAHLARLISSRTGVSPAEADRRITEVLGDAQSKAEIARKAAATALLWTFIALLIGAFSASYAATLGGRQRDHLEPIPST
jgi:hypothetical protein